MLILTITQLDINLEFNLIFLFIIHLFIYFSYISACNLVSVFMCVTTVKVIVDVCVDKVKLNYLHLILNQKEPYTVYVEN